MTIWRLILQEIVYRKLNFGLGLVAVAVAVACLVIVLMLLAEHDRQTVRLVAQREAETAQRMDALENDYRKITLHLGFNVLIVPKGQNLADLYANDFASKLMSEAYATRLANSSIVTINHLLPCLQEKLEWPEQQRTILLVGTRGEIPIAHRDPKKPLQAAISPGAMVVGYELAQNLNLQSGDRTTLLGREFLVSKTHPRRGDKDDITVWINLAEAQQLLDKPCQINAILALECECAGDRLAQVRAEISRVLPGTQVIEFAGQALARAEARNRAAVEAHEAVASERRLRARLRSRQEAFAAVLVPLVMIGCVVGLGLLALTNVRARRAEIGIWRAIGLHTNGVLAIFLGRALLLGVAGAALGYAVGIALSTLWNTLVLEGAGPATFDLKLLLPAVGVAPLLSLLASWLPALWAAQQDPAVALREE